jgi:hypothetical protein
MHNANTKQPVERQMSRPNLVQSSGHREESSAVRARLLLRRLLRARRILTTAKRTLTVTVIAAMVLAAGSAPALAVQQTSTDQGVQSAQQTPAELQQLVAPFALYPDSLVAQILAASTYPTQIVEAERWLQNHSNLKGEELAKEVDKESWDPSVKALTQFPSVLAKMNESLSWTSAVGDAYFNQQQDVLDAVQVMRKRAEDAGTLQSTSQQKVATQGSTIIIEPADPDVCYLPIYDPWTVYGAPLAVYPGYIFGPWDGPPFFFGPGIGLGLFGGFGWGFRFWGCDWGRREVLFNNRIFVSRSPSFFHRFPGDRGNFRPGQRVPSFRGNQDVGGAARNHGNGMVDRGSGSGRFRLDGSPNPGGRSGVFSPSEAAPSHREARGFGEEGSSRGTRSGAFSGIGQGGIERGSASRGESSMGRGGFGGGRAGGGGGGGGGMRGGGGGGRH